MPAFKTLRRVAHTPRQMFDLVADVERYPEFVPMCESLAILRREEEGRVLVARMGIGYKAIRENFTTRVRLWPEEPCVLVEYLDGPFSRLENRWRFSPAPGGACVEFFIDYEFRSPLLGLIAGGLFDKAFHRFSDAFDERARRVYGAVPAPSEPLSR